MVATCTAKYLSASALLVTLMASLTGCAGAVAPTEQVEMSRNAVSRAVTADATQYAPLEMKSAQDKLKEAELAMHEQEYDKARRLAEQAEWDARLAERKAQAAKAEQALQDARQGVQELREEGMRNAQ